MSIKIPVDAKIITEKKLTVIRVVKTLAEAIAEDGGMIDQVKETMQSKTVEFAQSDHVIAHLVGSKGRDTINTGDAYLACLAKKIPLKDFLACCTVSKKKLAAHLSEIEIETVSLAGPSFGGVALYTEFKPDIHAKADELAEAIAGPLGRHLGKLSKAA